MNNPIVIIYFVLSGLMGLFSYLDKQNILAYGILLGISIIILEPLRKRIQYEKQEYEKFKKSMRRN